MTFFALGAAVANDLGPGAGPMLRFSDRTAFARLPRSRKRVRLFLDWVARETPLAEAFVWSTCQRLELYAWLDDEPVTTRHPLVVRLQRELFGAPATGLGVNLLLGADAWHHLARTVCGLNSELPGDRDVADQLATAGRTAHCAGTGRSRTTALIDTALALAHDVHHATRWGTFSTGYCAAALTRLAEEEQLRYADLCHVVIGGSTTSSAVLRTLATDHAVPTEHLTLVYRDHHGQWKRLRTALGSGRRLRVHAYDDEAVLDAIANADCVHFGIDRVEPVLDAAMLRLPPDRRARPLRIIDFNSSGSVAHPDRLVGTRLWTAADLDRVVAVHGAVTVSRPGFGPALREAETRIAAERMDPGASLLEARVAGGGPGTADEGHAVRC
jgi:glutamyl-tRNA reductase